MTPEMVSIVVPVYKAEKYIIKTIESVAAQTYTNWELLLVDDCGGDSSADVERGTVLSFHLLYFRGERLFP